MDRLEELDRLLAGELPPERLERSESGLKIAFKWLLKALLWAFLAIGLIVWLLSQNNPSETLYRGLIGAGIGFLIFTWYRDWDQRHRDTSDRIRRIEYQVGEIHSILRRLRRD
jgi:hypothetical protein